MLGQTDILKYRTQHNTAEKVQEADSRASVLAGPGLDLRHTGIENGRLSVPRRVCRANEVHHALGVRRDTHRFIADQGGGGRGIGGQ